MQISDFSKRIILVLILGLFLPLQLMGLYPPDSTGPQVDENTFIGKKWVKLGGPGIDGIGLPTGYVTSTIYGGGEYQRFEGGVIVYSNTWGAVLLTIDLFDKWLALNTLVDSSSGNLLKLVGFPTKDFEEQDDLTVGVFEGGVLVQASGTVPEVIYGDICIKYETLGRTPGMPLGMEISSANGGRMQSFTYGNIYYHSNTGSHFVGGDILTRYLALGGPSSSYGYPISDEQVLLQDETEIGSMIAFESGNIYWRTDGGACEIPAGDILVEYEDVCGGPSQWLGLPICGYTLRTSGIAYVDFQGGMILHDTNSDNPNTASAWSYGDLNLHVERFTPYENDGMILAPNVELYVNIDINTNQGISIDTRYPNSGTDKNGGDVDLNYSLGSARSDLEITLRFQGRDDDPWYDPNGDDTLGTVTATYTIDEMWGLYDTGEHKSGNFGVTYSVQNPIEYDASDFRGTQFWSFDNFGTNRLDWDTYVETFADVRHDQSDWLHPFDYLYYHLAYKKVAKHGNCFGMCLEAIHALKGRSIYSEPIFRFWPETQPGVASNPDRELDINIPEHAATMHEINVKHGHQLSAVSIAYMLGMILSNEDHNPKGTFQQAELFESLGLKYMIGISRTWTKGGHVVWPYKLERRSNTEWVMLLADPSNPEAASESDNGYKITVNPEENTFVYNLSDSKEYSGDSFFGGRFFVYPYLLFEDAPFTPFVDVFTLINEASLMIFGSTGEACQVTDADGNEYYTSSTGGHDEFSDVNNSGPANFSRIPMFIDSEEEIPEIYFAKGKSESLTFSTKLKDDYDDGTIYEWNMNTPMMGAAVSIPGTKDVPDQLTMIDIGSPDGSFIITIPDNSVEKEISYTISAGKKHTWLKLDNLKMVPGQSISTSLGNGGLQAVIENNGPETTADLTVQYGMGYDSIYVGTITIGEGESTTVKFDAPKTTLTYTGEPDEWGWLMTYPEITLTAKDYSGTGIDYIEYSYDNSNWIRYTGTFIYEVEGISIIYYRAKDNDGNQEEVRSQEFKINIAPYFFRFDDVIWEGVNCETFADSSRYTEGTGSMGVSGEGYMELLSPYFMSREISYLCDKITLDLYIPSPPANPYWIGDIELRYSNPRANIYNVGLGRIDLTGKEIGEWNTLEFDVPEEVLQGLMDYSGASQFRIKVNMPLSGKTYNIDNMRFKGDLFYNENFRTESDEVIGGEFLGFENLDDWTCSSDELSAETSRVTQGFQGISVYAGGYKRIDSREFHIEELGDIGKTIKVDLYIPSPNIPEWAGDLQMFITCRPNNNYNVYKGIRLLSELEVDTFNTLTFTLTDEEYEILTTEGFIGEFAFVINANSEPRTFVIDNIRFED